MQVLIKYGSKRYDIALVEGESVKDAVERWLASRWEAQQDTGMSIIAYPLGDAFDVRAKLKFEVALSEHDPSETEAE